MARIIIMGASSGIGLATAEALASRGIKVGLAARHTEALHELKKLFPDNVEYMSIDITRPVATRQLSELIDKLGGMDVYLHVAGIGYENLDLDPEREVEIAKTNVCGFSRMVCAAYRYFREHGNRGHIAAVTSVAGTNGIGRLSAYSASKAYDQRYLVALEQLAHAEGADIAFTDIRPGWTDTPLLHQGDKYPMEMRLSYVVPQLLYAIARRKRVCTIDWRWDVVSRLWRLIPDRLWVHLRVPISTPDEPLPQACPAEDADVTDDKEKKA